MYCRLSSYVKDFNILVDSQHGFRANYSTESAIAQFIKPIYHSLEKRHYYFAICIDFSKAFDCLNYEVLLTKLENIGIRGPALSLMSDYLHGRTQVVYYNGQFSDPADLLHGTPQGSQLGPLLFDIYINDIVRSSDTLTFSLYADDSNIGNSGQDFRRLVDSTNRELSCTIGL